MWRIPYFSAIGKYYKFRSWKNRQQCKELCRLVFGDIKNFRPERIAKIDIFPLFTEKYLKLSEELMDLFPSERTNYGL